MHYALGFAWVWATTSHKKHFPQSQNWQKKNLHPSFIKTTIFIHPHWVYIRLMGISQLHNIIPLGVEKELLMGVWFYSMSHDKKINFLYDEFFWHARNIVLIFLMGEGIFLMCKTLKNEGFIFLNVRNIVSSFLTSEGIFWCARNIVLIFLMDEGIFWRARNFVSIFSTGESIF